MTVNRMAATIRKGALLMLFVLLIMGAAYFIGCSSTQEGDMIDTSVVSNVDLERYTGVWYEIARFPHNFEKDLVGVTATYTIRDDGKIGVLNQGYKGSFEGRFKKAKAKATIPDPQQPARLKVFFFPLVGAEYNIMMLDDDYQYALVGSSTPNFLWILSRTPQMDEDTYDMLVAEARRRGYDVSKLEKVPQK